MAYANKSRPEKKKADNELEQQFLGKIEKNNCSLGIVGLPNVGKSSLFNCFSSKQVPAENYAFCTIDPTKAVIPVPDKKFLHLCNKWNPASKVKAVLQVWDIAGLVSGAHDGKGLGNEFLSQIQSVDAIYHLVRAFTDKKIEHVEGDVNPIRDMEIITRELRLKDKLNMSKIHESMQKLVKRTPNDKALKDEFKIVERVMDILQNDKDVQMERWSEKAIYFMRKWNLFTAKPIVFLVNVSKKNWISKHNKHVVDIQNWCKQNYPHSLIVPFSAAFEADLLKMDIEERENYLIEHKIKSAMNGIIKAGYKALNFVNFYTVGKDEVRAWTIRKGWTAPMTAGVIHSDMQDGFIAADVYNYKDYKKLDSSLEKVKKKGLYRTLGKHAIIKEGDICFFKFNPAKKKK